MTFRARRFLLPARTRVFLVAAAALLSVAAIAEGIILYRTGDPAANTTAPVGALVGSGWQYQGTFGSYLGTAIAPLYFITAQHVGTSDKFVFQGAQYTIVNSFDDPETDLRICEVAEPLPIYAPLYTGLSEVGKHLIVIGRGKQRGASIVAGGKLRGWYWGATDEVQRWGENVVAAIKEIPGAGEMVYALFDKPGLPNEAHLANGDSAGAVFVNDGGTWKLAGINYDVDYVYTGPNGAGILFAALFDERSFYGPNRLPVTGNAPVPSGFYASRISSRIGWIASIIEPRLANISARATVGIGDQVSIAGFIIKGNPGQSRRVIIRGLGPSLQVNGVPVAGRLVNPLLELHNGTGALVSLNDNWRAGAQANAIQSVGFAPSDEREAALFATLPVGEYTAILRGAGGSTGIGLIEVYDADGIGNARLLNLSARANVGTGDRVLIGGLIVHSVSQRLLLRAIGPDLAGRGVTGELRNPVLELHDSNGALLSTNDNWRNAPNSSEIIATGLAPIDARESAILLTPGPGAYTAIVRGAGATAGVALLEAYLLE
jgi:hypothetical protein